MDSETNLTTTAGEEEEAVLTKAELEVVMAVFKSFETGLREATIYPKVLSHKYATDISHSKHRCNFWQ